MGSTATRWRLLSGQNEWEGLLDPLDIDLRRYLIHYGERAGANGDAFISERKSSNRGLPRYAKRNLFSEVGLEKNNPYKYAVKKYVYGATLLSPGASNWLGYVAVATDEGKQKLGRRDILIAWRGTELAEELAVDALFSLTTALILGGKAKVHSGWLSYYTHADPFSPRNKTSCRAQVLAAIRELVDQYKDEETSITVTGHSMGASLATLSAVDIAYNNYNTPTGNPSKPIMVTAIVFASPLVGDQGFRQLSSSLENLHILRVKNLEDVITYLPPPGEYVPVGKELMIDSLKSPYLKNALLSVHDLEVYLHVIAGTQGKSSDDFKLEVDRDIALVNKGLDGLKDELNVVAQWWTAKNKSMVQMDDASWVLMDHEKDDDI